MIYDYFSSSTHGLEIFIPKGLREARLMISGEWFGKKTPVSSCV